LETVRGVVRRTASYLHGKVEDFLANENKLTSEETFELEKQSAVNLKEDKAYRMLRR